MAATTGLFAASMAWIMGTSGGPDMFVPNSLMSAPVMQIKLVMLSVVLRGASVSTSLWMED